MIYLQVGILILEITLCILLNNLLKDKLDKKIRYALCIALLLNCWNMRTYQAMWAVHTLFCLLILLLIFKKRKPTLCIILSAIISTSIVTFGYVNMYTIHQTNYNLTTEKNINPTKICFIADVHYPNANNPERLKAITNTLMKVKPDFYLLGGDFVDESTSTKDMNVLFKQLGRLTKIAPVYFVYGNHENKIKFTRNKLDQAITKNNITILNDQEVQLSNITLVGRKDYTNPNRKKTKDYHLTNKTYNIVLDHQPQGTKENIKNNVDLQLSGHTHNGQMFPLSYSYHLQLDFAGNYGKETFRNYTKIISSGLVGWGFPIRTEGICEYVVVNVTPKK